jgi:NitT/TauT family transport system ATP-binding protein
MAFASATVNSSGDAGTALSALEATDVSKTYGDGPDAVRALEPLSLSVPPNDFVSVIGPSGCGKTTLLKILGDIIKPTTGTVTIAGERAERMRPARRIGYVFQTPVLLPWRTVHENVFLPAEIAGAKRRRSGRAQRLTEVRGRIDATLDTFGLGEFADRLPSELSGGMQSRVSLARALVAEPAVLLMDEPFAALDELTRSEMALYLLDVWQRVRTTVVFVTHHIEEAVLLSNRVCVMSRRPARIERMVDVHLPRPRSLETRRLPEFRELVEDLMETFMEHSRS